MSSLSKRIFVIVVVGIGAIGGARLLGRWNGDERYAATSARLDAECRAFRSNPRYRNANVCHGFDAYAPRATALYPDAKAFLDKAAAESARGDTHAAEASLRRALVVADEIERLGDSVSQTATTIIVDRALDIVSEHPDIDRRTLLRDVRLTSVAHPLQPGRLGRQWYLLHQSELPGQAGTPSKATLADTFERSDVAFRAMEEELVKHHDAVACAAAGAGLDADDRLATSARAHCDHALRTVEVATRLDAMRR